MGGGQRKRERGDKGRARDIKVKGRESEMVTVRAWVPLRPLPHLHTPPLKVPVGSE